MRNLGNRSQISMALMRLPWDKKGLAFEGGGKAFSGTAKKTRPGSCRFQAWQNRRMQKGG